MRFYQPFPAAIPLYEAGYPRVTHPSATKCAAKSAEASIKAHSVRLACVKHAASVHPEPGSNSHVKMFVCPFQEKHLVFLSPFYFRFVFVVRLSPLRHSAA